MSGTDGKSLIGEWAGSGEGRVTANVRADPNRPGHFLAEINTQAGACTGSVEVAGELGNVAVATAELPYEQGAVCRIELRLIGADRLRVSEVDNCLNFHGAACGFTAELTRRGMEAAAAAPRTAGRPPPPAGGRGGQVPWAPECEFLRLDPAFAPVEVAATASPEGIDCYAIKPIAGTDVTIEIAEGRNVVLSISGLVDAVDRHRFRASGFGYRVTVGQLMRSMTQEPYRITFSSGAILPLSEAASASKGWSVYGNAGEGRLGAQGLAKDGVTTVSIGCNRLLGKTLGGSLDGYTGNGLTRVDDETDTLVFEFLDARGRRASFESKVNYFAPDKAWAFRDFPEKMLAPFARGSKLSLRNGRGMLIAEFGLKGTARAVAAMRTECGF
ncbi:hypothetical protein GCM10007285_25710 [Stappia taiwanensis]|nr:hypothetical protein GCM10007285_25710 [Stappia taiwanensis]